MPKLGPLKLLSRSDKWYLGSGGPLLWTPSFPLWLDRPGFWDSGWWCEYDFGPLFAITLLDERGTEIPLEAISRKWNPAFLEQRYVGTVPERRFRIQVTERKMAVGGEILASEISVKNLSSKKATLNLVAWTAVKRSRREKSDLHDLKSGDGSIEFIRELKSRTRPPVSLHCKFAMEGSQSHLILHTEDSPMQPRWELTPFGDRFIDGRFSGNPESIGEREGFVYMALQLALRLKADEEATLCATFSVQKAVEEGSGSAPPISEIRHPISLITRTRSTWEDFFSSVPHFDCSDVYLTRYYWYRWFGLKFFSMEGGEGFCRHPFICEGPGYFRAAISYSAQCHMRETRWMKTPKYAQGSLRNFIDHQKPDGSFWGYIGASCYYEGSFYHANWGKALLEVDRVHPDEKYLSVVYEGLKRYAEYFDRERDRERSGLYDVVNHFETGQEYMRRYLAIDPKADAENWGNVFRMKGVDATVYLYELKTALAEIAERLGKGRNDQQRWRDGAEKTKEAVLRKMWDPEVGMFFDVNPLTLKRTGVKAAICFYPYMTDIVDESHLTGLKRHLLNPTEFWTPYPVPSTSVDDPMFSAEGVWKGRRMNCPWNGRVWPMTNSHVAEALAQSAIRFRDQELREKAAEFLTTFIKMMFYDGDPERPNCFEHYHPYNGTPSTYRGIDDYQHSWVVDLIIKYVAGLRPQKDSVIVDPFPFKLREFVLDNVVVRGLRFRVQGRGKRFLVFVDGKKVSENAIGEPFTLKV